MSGKPSTHCDDNGRVCTRCYEYKTWDKFHSGNGTNGKQSYCKSCVSFIKEADPNHVMKRKAADKKSYDKLKTHPDKYRDRTLRKKYHITLEQYQEMLEAQGGICLTCKKECSTGRRLAVDHDHKCCEKTSSSCGECVRALLCSSCNVTLGRVNDDPEVLRRMIKLVEEGTPHAFLKRPREGREGTEEVPHQ